ncbi:MAG: bifunctional 2',3'-cyclic-nucleotide 2'-phosphodiesterase/3'-nucleotidase [Pseudomonadota bacterium]
MTLVDAPVSGDVHLRILNLTDLHMAIRPYDYFADSETPGPGLTNAASYLERLKAGAPNTLVFDNGDFLQGNPMGDYAAQNLETSPDAAHPMIDALNALNIDAGTLGNHEFNYGLEVLFSALKQTRFPVVSANLLWPSQDQEWNTVLPPFALLERDVKTQNGEVTIVKVGVLGVLPPQVQHWDRSHLEGKIQTRDIVETVEKYVPQMKSAGADLIVILCHSGIEASANRYGLENASVQVATIEGVDAVISGHSHLVFPSPYFGGFAHTDIERGLIHGKPVTMAGFGASHIGRIDLLLGRTNGAWSLRRATATADPVPIDAVPETEVERQILSATAQAHNETLAYIRRPVGHTVRRIDSDFAMIQPCSAVRFIAAAQDWHLRNALRGGALEDTPMLSSAAPFKMGGRGGPGNFTRVPAGQLKLRNIADIYGYPNALCALRVDGTALSDWLEFSAGIFCQITPGQHDQWLIDPTFPSYNFDTIAGLTYEIDLSQPARFTPSGELIHKDNRRIRALSYRGADVTPDMTFIVATNDYRANGSGSYPGADDGQIVWDERDAHRDVLVRYVEDTPHDRTFAARPWRFSPMLATSVLFRTTPLAGAELSRLRRLRVSPLETDVEDFLVCRLDLQ